MAAAALGSVGRIVNRIAVTFGMGRIDGKAQGEQRRHTPHYGIEQLAFALVEHHGLLTLERGQVGEDIALFDRCAGTAEDVAAVALEPFLDLRRCRSAAQGSRPAP